VQGPARLAVADASLLIADRLLRERRIEEARALYRELHQPKEARAIRLAAFRGLVRAAGDDAGAMILDALAGTDADARAVAIGEIATASPGALKALAARVDQLPVTVQVLMLGALAARGDRAQHSIALAAVKSPEESVRRAGLLALGKLGDVSTVPLLVKTLLDDPKLGSAARESLVAVTGTGVDERILAALQEQKDAGRSTTLISVLESRRSAVAVPLLLQYAQGTDAGLRSAAMNALRQLADVKDVPALIQGLLRTGKGREREEAEKTIVAVSAKDADVDHRVAVVLPLVDGGSKDEAVIVLPLLGRLGGERARQAVQHALASPSADLHDAAVQALCNWPDPSVSDDLVRLARDGKQPQERQQALRNLVRVNSLTSTLPGDKANAPRLLMLQKSMELADRDDERNLVLDGLASVKEVATLRYVLPYLDHKTLNQRACKTVVELAHSKTLREPNKAEFDLALDRVIGQCRDKGLVERAKKYKEGQ
jgi:HEAT repeat protein